MAEIAVINKDNTDYDIRDKKLADHTSASTDTSKVSSTSSIMLEASDGSFVSVKRDSFVNAIRDVLGSSIVANTGGTSDVNTIPALTSSGGLKSVSTADIASVLGVNKYGVKDSVDLNDYKKTGTLLARNNCTNTPDNSEWWNVSIIGEELGSCTQIASLFTSSTSIAENLGYTYIRTYKFDQEVWSNWRDITTCRQGKYVCGQYEGTTAYELYDALDAKTTFTAEINEGGVHYFITGYKLSDLYGGFLKCTYFGSLVSYFWKYNGYWNSRVLLSE